MTSRPSITLDLCPNDPNGKTKNSRALTPKNSLSQFFNFRIMIKKIFFVLNASNTARRLNSCVNPSEHPADLPFFLLNDNNLDEMAPRKVCWPNCRIPEKRDFMDINPERTAEDFYRNYDPVSSLKTFENFLF
jgi:hypothetical protein